MITIFFPLPETALVSAAREFTVVLVPPVPPVVLKDKVSTTPKQI